MKKFIGKTYNNLRDVSGHDYVQRLYETARSIVNEKKNLVVIPLTIKDCPSEVIRGTKYYAAECVDKVIDQLSTGSGIRITDEGIKFIALMAMITVLGYASFKYGYWK